jgi:hypothetical protein
VSINNMRRENRIRGRVASFDGLIAMGSHGSAMQNATEPIADDNGTFHKSGDGRLWSESVHA